MNVQTLLPNPYHLANKIAKMGCFKGIGRVLIHLLQNHKYFILFWYLPYQHVLRAK